MTIERDVMVPLSCERSEPGRGRVGHSSDLPVAAPPTDTPDMRNAMSLRDRSRYLRRSAPSPERRLWTLLREWNRLGCHFRRQVPLGPYVVDFAWLSLCLVVEIDGEGHLTREGRAADIRRDQWLGTGGLVILRFWNSEVVASPEDVSDRIVAVANRLRLSRGLAPVVRD